MELLLYRIFIVLLLLGLTFVLNDTNMRVQNIEKSVLYDYEIIK